MRRLATNHHRQFFDLRLQGRTLAGIARTFGFSEPTIRRGIDLLIAEYLKYPPGHPDRILAEKLVPRPKTLVQAIRHNAKAKFQETK